MELTKELWGKSACGKEIYLYTLKNESGAYVQLSSVGAGIVSVVVPDKDGVLADVALGYPEASSYFGDGPCAGKVPGRFANRIALGKFTLDGVEYELPINNGPNHLHGGPKGFQNKVWESREHEGGIEFLYYSEDGEMGYPGALKTVARYEWTEENELRLTLTAEADAPTIVNLTNHAYFNLNGEGSGSVLNHVLRLNASEYLPTSDSLIPVGESEPVAGTPMDFVNPKVIGAEIKTDFPALNYGKGYDNCWVIEVRFRRQQSYILQKADAFFLYTLPSQECRSTQETGSQAARWQNAAAATTTMTVWRSSVRTSLMHRTRQTILLLSSARAKYTSRLSFSPSE